MNFFDLLVLKRDRDFGGCHTNDHTTQTVQSVPPVRTGYLSEDAAKYLPPLLKKRAKPDIDVCAALARCLLEHSRTSDFLYSVHMRSLCVAVLLVAPLALPVAADTREVIKTTVAGHETVFAEYIQGKNMRTEDLTPHGSRRRIMIQNFERKTIYELDPQSREYVELRPRSSDWLVLLAEWIARPPRTRESGKVVNIYYETVDTGERKQFFGHTAEHLLMRERHVAEPGACDFSHQIERDGWYIPRNERGAPRVSYGYVLHGGIECRDTVVNHGHPSVSGVPVLETDGPVTREILELSNDPLDAGLFDLPVGFRKVDALPGYRPMSWSERLDMEWGQLERAFESWFE